MNSFAEMSQIIGFCRMDCEQKVYCEKCRFEGLPNCQDYKMAKKLIEFGFSNEDISSLRTLSFFKTFNIIDDIIEICEIPKETVFMKLALKQCGLEYKGLSEEELKEAYKNNCMGYGFDGF